jgi:hypothetical protein
MSIYEPVEQPWDPAAAYEAQQRAEAIRDRIESYVTAIIKIPGLRQTRVPVLDASGEQRKVPMRKYIRIMRREAVGHEREVTQWGGQAAVEAYKQEIGISEVDPPTAA